jgi:hypothetical protein
VPGVIYRNPRHSLLNSPSICRTRNGSIALLNSVTPGPRLNCRANESFESCVQNPSRLLTWAGRFSTLTSLSSVESLPRLALQRIEQAHIQSHPISRGGRAWIAFLAFRCSSLRGRTFQQGAEQSDRSRRAIGYKNPAADRARHVLGTSMSSSRDSRERRREPRNNALFVQRAAAIRRWDVCFDEVCCPLIGVDLILNAREAMPFVLVDFVLGHASALFYRLHYLQRF